MMNPTANTNDTTQTHKLMYTTQPAFHSTPTTPPPLSLPPPDTRTVQFRCRCVLVDCLLLGCRLLFAFYVEAELVLHPGWYVDRLTSGQLLHCLLVEWAERSTFVDVVDQLTIPCKA